jgi:hypothetical protein
VLSGQGRAARLAVRDHQQQQQQQQQGQAKKSSAPAVGSSGSFSFSFKKLMAKLGSEMKLKRQELAQQQQRRRQQGKQGHRPVPQPPAAPDALLQQAVLLQEQQPVLLVPLPDDSEPSEPAPSGALRQLAQLQQQHMQVSSSARAPAPRMRPLCPASQRPQPPPHTHTSQVLQQIDGPGLRYLESGELPAVSPAAPAVAAGPVPASARLQALEEDVPACASPSALEGLLVLGGAEDEVSEEWEEGEQRAGGAPGPAGWGPARPKAPSTAGCDATEAHQAADARPAGSGLSRWDSAKSAAQKGGQQQQQVELQQQQGPGAAGLGAAQAALYKTETHPYFRSRSRPLHTLPDVQPPQDLQESHMVLGD